jgi:hypothetical protein
MTFVSPLLLAGTSLVVLPIVLHLLMQRKPKLVEFPALRFVAKRRQTSQRRLRMRHWLLLLLRMLLIVILAFALARPSLRRVGAGAGGQKAPVAAVLVFDTSKRMDFRFENRSRLEVAQELGVWLLAQLPPESHVAVLDSRLAAAAFQVDLGSAKHRIERLETVAAAQPLPVVLCEALRLLGTSELTRKEIYVFTDLAKTAWPGDDAARMQDRYRESTDVGVQLIDVGLENPTNLALGDLRLSSQVLANRSSLHIESELIPRGIRGKRTVELYVLEPSSDPKDPEKRAPRKAGEEVVEFDANQPQRLEFTVAGLSLGTHQGYLQILGQDGLACDDRRYFTVEVRPPWQVLIAAPKPADNYSVYLANALAPETSRRRGDAKFGCAVVTLGELATVALEPYSAVAVLDPTPLEPATWQRLVNFAADGRGLAVFLGRNAEPVDSFNRVPAQTLLSGTLLRQAIAPSEGFHMTMTNLEHPVLAGFRGVASAGVWMRSPIFRYWQLGDLARGAHPIVSLTNGEPILLERPVGRGRVLTMTTPISDPFSGHPWNLVPAEWPFLALADGMMAYLSGGSNQNLNYTPGQTAILDLDPKQDFQSYILTSPDGSQAQLMADSKRHAVAANTTDQSGNYRIRAGGKDGVDRGFSVNLAADQTRFDRVNNDELAKLFGVIPHRLAQNREQIDINISSGRVGRELFGLLILAMALALGLEHWLANRFYRE